MFPPAVCEPISSCQFALLVQLPLAAFFFFFFFFFLGPLLWYMEGSRLGDEPELQLLASATATAMWDPSCICDLHHSSWRYQILNPLSEARDGSLHPHGYQ